MTSLVENNDLEDRENNNNNNQCVDLEREQLKFNQRYDTKVMTQAAKLMNMNKRAKESRTSKARYDKNSYIFLQGTCSPYYICRRPELQAFICVYERMSRFAFSPASFM